jgi:hypothetical protein
LQKAGGVNASFIDGFSSQSFSFSTDMGVLDAVGEPGFVSPPNPEFAGPPAGRGLQTSPEGWPEGSVKTAGGYVVVPDGNTNWDIFNPGSKPGDKPDTHIWGDPHVSEKDGGRWDFTKTSDFTLPDGTKITAKTSAETGQSVTTGLEITNGMDHVSVEGVNTGKPTTSAVQHDGYEYRATENAKNPNRPEFKLGGDGDDWFMVKDGKMGEITGASLKDGSYDQNVDDKGYHIDRDLARPGSKGWAQNQRAQAFDFITGKLGLPPWMAESVGQSFHQDHAYRQMFESMQQLSAYTGPFGGMYGMAFGFDGMFDAMGGMADAMNNLNYLQASQRGFRSQFLY